MAIQGGKAREASNALALAWALGRLPLLLALAFLFRIQILAAIESVFDIVWITEFTIAVASTPLTRVLFAIGTAAAFFVIVKLCERWTGPKGHGLALLGCGAVSWIVCATTQSNEKLLLLVAVLLAANWAPASWLARIGLTEPRLRALIAIPPGIGEALQASRYLGWISALVRRAPYVIAETPGKAPGAIIAGLVLALLLNGMGLAPIARALRSNSDVRVFAQGDFNGLALDATGRYLFVTGHGIGRLLRYDTQNLDAEPLAGVAETAGAQGLAYDAARNEVYLFNGGSRELLVFDGATLAVKRSIQASELSPGDPWVAIDPISNRIALVSEADQQSGTPILVLDRDTGSIVDERSEEAGNVLMHPTKSILYLSFFRRERGVLAYDMATGQVIARGPTDHRMERLTFDAAANEVLVTSPVEGEVIRFDADTLEQKGRFDAIFGVRVLTIDPTRHTLLAGSLVTGEITALDMPSHERRRTWYLGPWLRSIVIAPDRGVAYVSSQGALYEFHYARPDR